MVAQANELLSKDANKDAPFMGLLDIFGFENQPTNGFEQLLINFTNERLQGLFNQLIVEEEQETFRKENITGVKISPAVHAL